MSEAIHSFFGPGPLVRYLTFKKVLTTLAHCAIMITVRKKGDKKMFKRIKKYLWCKKMGINHPWKASGDKKFLRMY